MAEVAPSYTVTTHEEPDGSFWAEVDQLPGCFASGDTMDELWENVGEAIGLYLSEGDQHVMVSPFRVTEIEPAEKKFELATT